MTPWYTQPRNQEVKALREEVTKLREEVAQLRQQHHCCHVPNYYPYYVYPYTYPYTTSPYTVYSSGITFGTSATSGYLSWDGDTKNEN